LAIAALLLGIAVTLSWFIGRLLASIERLRASEGYFQRLSHIDPLTGLGNRRRFDESLRRVLPRSGKEAPTSLLVFDVNSLKTINDLAGHPSGDRALQAVARAIRTSTRETDIAARMGGDEFAVILPHLALSGAKKVAERIRRQLDEFEIDGIDREIVLSVSVGMATATSPDVEAEALLAEADQDLYHGRRHVRRTVQEPALS
jgi:diguanylate cyclase (GGDEF)-like protein